jgi:hypothetical protein
MNMDNNQINMDPKTLKKELSQIKGSAQLMKESQPCTADHGSFTQLLGEENEKDGEKAANSMVSLSLTDDANNESNVKPLVQVRHDTSSEKYKSSKSKDSSYEVKKQMMNRKNKSIIWRFLCKIPRKYIISQEN